MDYPDTSFLVSLYLNDQNGEAAIKYVENHGGPLLLTPLTRIEMSNAFRVWQFRKILPAVKVRSIFRDVAEDIVSGFLQEAPVEWNELLTIAEDISLHHTPLTGNRTLDILHVAAAKSLGSKVFLSFDSRQRTLAQRIGLEVMPCLE